LFVREVLGIEASLPFLVGITAGANEEIHRVLQGTIRRGLFDQNKFSPVPGVRSRKDPERGFKEA
jgi:hypothetical protein